MGDESKNRPDSSGTTYRDAGVNIDAKYQAIKDAQSAIQSTWTKGVVGDFGSFGGLFSVPWQDYEQPLLVSSADGVGTKIKVAAECKIHNTVGQDLVNHCVNDILVQGAKPLFFMDYVGTGKIESGMVPAIVDGLARGCKENDCALLGGETAEMPGVYQPGDYDLVGFIVGIVDRKKLVDGSSIQPGDQIIGIPSAGLHTNGYSLARKVLFEDQGLNPQDRHSSLEGTVGEALLATHLSYYQAVYPLLDQFEIHGMAHITGGGLPDNIPRVLPENCDVSIQRDVLPVPPIFSLIEKLGSVPRDDMDRTFNMGVGYVLMVPQNQSESITQKLQDHFPETAVIGEVVAGQRRVLLT